MFDMNWPASSGEVMANAGMYWILSVVIFMILDRYASKKLGGPRMLGYKILRVPRFYALILVSAITIGVLIWVRFGGLQLTYNQLTYLGLPYFIIWVFVLTNFLRRIRAETKGKPGGVKRR